LTPHPNSFGIGISGDDPGQNRPASEDIKLSIYRHFDNKEALFSAAIVAGCSQSFAPQALLEGVEVRSKSS
jgi:hypothetical protein